MTADDLKRLAGLVAAMWPGQTIWPPSTITVAAPQFAAVDYADAERAVAELMRGRDYPPPPGVVLGRAEEIAARRPRLAEPELLRLPTPAERAETSAALPQLRAAIDSLARRKDPKLL